MSQRQRVQVLFRKGEGARFLSHLDLMATLEFALRRAQLPFELSEGFNPRPRMALAAPLALGHIGEREVLEITLREHVDPAALREQLQSALPPGITIHSASEVPADGKSAAARVRSSRYRIELREPVTDLAGRVTHLLDHDSLEVEEEREGGRRRRDLRPLILSLEVPQQDVLILTVAIEHQGSVRPEQVLDLLGLPRDGVAITRESIEIAPG